MRISLKFFALTLTLVACFTVAKTAYAFGGSGVDGAINISSSININTATTSMSRTCADGIAYNVTALTATSAALATSLGASCLAVNDVIILINLQADGTNLGNVGNYEFLRVKSTSSSAVYFTSSKAKYYGNGTDSDDTNIGTTTSNQRVIIQRVPQYTNVTIQSGGTLTASAWDGQKGGVLVFWANGTVDIQSGGSVNMWDKGYRGGYAAGCGFGPIYGYQGESYNALGIEDVNPNYGGGGGASIDSEDNCSAFYMDIAGGGGGYGGAGVVGNGRDGGTYGSADLNKIFMGSGSGGYVDDGSSGGGIIFIKANAIIINSIQANGRNGNDNSVGSSGGSIYIISNSLTNGVSNISAIGGTYGGGLGRIALKADTITGTSSPLASSTSVLTKEFMAVVDPDNGAGTDFTSLNAWEAATQADLTSDYTKVFGISSASGTFQVGDNLVGLTSGATASSTYHTATQVLLYNIQGTFLSGERIYVQGQSTTTNYVIISDDGFQAIAVASCRSTNGTADQTAVTIDGWTTSATNYIKIWTDPGVGARHNGKWDSSKYVLQASSSISVLDIEDDYIRVDGLQIRNYGNSGNYSQEIYIHSNASNVGVYHISNNILKNDGTGTSRVSLECDQGNTIYAHNNTITLTGGTVRSTGMRPYRGTWYIYNNTISGTIQGSTSYGGIYANGNSTTYIKNNIVFNNYDDFYLVSGTNNLDYNASDDGDGSHPVDASPSGNESADWAAIFADYPNGDFHLKSTDNVARNAGTSTILWDSNLSFTQDIDGSYRGAAWDIGADEVPTEFVSTICENASAGGGCANLNYNNLFAWEEQVDGTDYTASATRVFSGSLTGSILHNDFVTLYRAGSSTGITGTVPATTTTQIIVRGIAGTSTPLNVQSGDQWRKDGSNYWTASGTLDQLGASIIVTAKIDGAWANPDTTAFGLGGFTTGYDNYIKIYTTPTARHDGKWNSNKYRLEVTANATSYAAFDLSEDNVKVSGLQIKVTTNGYGTVSGMYSVVDNGELLLDSNIINFNTTSSGGYGIYLVVGTNSINKHRIYNNVVYGTATGTGARGILSEGTLGSQAYNNTVVGSQFSRGIWGYDAGKVIALNNVVRGVADGFFGTFDASSSDYNSSDVSGDAPALSPRSNSVSPWYSGATATSSIFVDASNYDFHLKPDSLFVDIGTSSPYGFFTADIDSAARPSLSSGLVWDLGADETATKIYRSIAPSASSALASGAANALSISSSTSLATFATALADNIGVGDVIIYNSGGTATATAFIHGRSSSTVYTVKTASGTTPTAITGDTSWSIYRAYTTLANAEAGIENTGVPSAVRNFDDWTVGGTAATDDVGKDIKISNEQWNVAAYVNGTTNESGVTLDGWTTGQQSFIKIYTPVTATEVGTSQRHNGKWDDAKFRVNNMGCGYGVMNYEEYVWIDGIQFNQVCSGTSNPITLRNAFTNANSETKISNNILWGDYSGMTGGSYNAKGISNSFVTQGPKYVWNNIFYGYISPTAGGSIALHVNTNTVYVFNNTISDSYIGISAESGTVYAKNNVTYGNSDNYSGNYFNASSSNNLSGPTQSDAPGISSVNAASISFVDAANKDFHLAPTDTAALDAGTSTPLTELSSWGASELSSLSHDIDGQLRRQWDIGADEGSEEYVTSVMESGGNFSTLSAWESANQVDLATSSTAVFSLSSASGTIPANSSIMGLTSGAVASTTVGSVSTSTQILLYNIASSTFLSGERIYILGAATTSNYAIFSNAGNPAIATAMIDGVWSNPDTISVSINGFITGPNNYVRVYSTPMARHNGRWDSGKYRLEYTTTATFQSAISVNDDHVRIEGLQILETYNHDNSQFLSVGNLTAGNNQVFITNNIIRGSTTVASVGPQGIRLAYGNALVKVWNNIIYDIRNSNDSAGTGIVIAGASPTNQIVYNNTVFNTYNAIADAVSDGGVVKNNIVQNSTIGFSGSFSSASDYNLSDIASDAPGTNSKNGVIVEFRDKNNNDFHLSSSDTAARNAGTSTVLWDANLSFTQDIDGSYRGAAWDIGADEVPTEFVSTICENTSAGGDCANLDYQTLSVWEDKVETDLAASTTRVFSGYLTGVLTENTVCDVFVGGVNTGIDVRVQATTSGQILIDSVIGTGTPLTVASGTEFRDGGTANMWTVTGTLDQLGASPIAVAKIDGAWANPDTTNVRIFDWTTSADNYIKIYTTPTARHDGKWNTSRYRIESVINDALEISEDFVRVDGLQLYINKNGVGGGGTAARITNNNVNNDIRLNNSILTGAVTDSYTIRGVQIEGVNSGARIYNNIIYGFRNGVDGNCIGIYSQGIAYVYNNTVYNSGVGLFRSTGLYYAKNNIVQNCAASDCYAGTFATSSDYNISDIAGDAPNLIFATTSKIVSFVSTSTPDFHLADTDTSAKGQGVNLYNEATINVANDIDSAARPPLGVGLSWDIGADQTAVQIYRSIAPSATTALTTGASNAVTILSSTSLATFATALADNIGVGDVIIYNTGGTATATAFIHSRSSSTVYTVKTASGTTPVAVTGDTTWSIYRAFTSLSNAEAGTENTGIANATIRNFDAWSGGADLVASNTQWNIAAYANGTTADTVNANFLGWNSGQQNYLKIYTPVSSSEVGTSQRHNGKWSDTSYKRESSSFAYLLDVSVPFVRIEGLQIYNSYATNSAALSIGGANSLSSHIVVNDNIIRGGTLSGLNADLISNIYLFNNIVYDSGTGISIYKYSDNANQDWKIYNNTVYNSTTCFKTYTQGYVTAKNNIAQNCTDGFSGTFNASSDNNLSNLASDAPSPSYRNNLATAVSFVDATNKDFHLAPTDTAALDAGTSSPLTELSSWVPSELSSLSLDIDGNYRRQWDIGADEASVEYVTTVMDSGMGGVFTSLSAWEAANQVDLTATTTAVFSLSSASGTIPANSSVMGLTSGAVASTTVGSVSTSTQILFYNIASSTFLSGERIYILGAATTSNYAILSNAGNPAIAIAKIDGAWAGADATAVTIDGWTTDPNNYVRIYTTPTARHNGKWDGNKYNRSNFLISNVSFIKVDGLQFSLTTSGTYNYFVEFNCFNGAVAEFSNSIIKASLSGGAENNIGLLARWTASGLGTFKAWNNLIYGFGNGGFSNTAVYSYSNWNTYFYNNTIQDSFAGIRTNSSLGGIIAKNNIIQSTNDSYGGSTGGAYAASSSNNISNMNDAPGTNSKNGVVVSLVDVANKDFHLAPTDTAAKDAGADLSADANLAFATDIDGQFRGAQATSSAGGLGWDIGADEGATIMYRSVGNDASDLNTGGATVTIASTTATFSSALANNIGIGDVMQYGNPLTLAFITGRASSTVYSVANATGSLPIATTSATASIYRAHTLLNNWQTQTAGTVNQSIDSGLRSQVLVARNLAVSNTAMFVTAYASSSADNTTVTINNWTTAAGNFIRVYTPVSESEVGLSQRHTGKWDDTKFTQKIGSSSTENIYIQDDFIRIEGLQLESSSINNSRVIYSHWISADNDIKIYDNIIRKNSTHLGDDMKAITAYDSPPTANLKVLNNIIYNFACYYCQSISGFDSNSAYIYNNTIYNAQGMGIIGAPSGESVVARNNLVQGINMWRGGYYNTFASSSSNNISEDSTSPNSGNTDCGGHSCRNQAVNFLDTANADFHLAPTDGQARDAGVNLSADPYLPFTIDIDGNARPQGPAWDIGADEAINTPDFLIKGKFKLKGKIKFSD